IATLRQARQGMRPDPLAAAMLCEEAGAWGITAHLREDRRHIQDRDIAALASKVKHLNMEMAVTDEMLEIACRIKPTSCCLVPEKRLELTTEGGLDAAGNLDKIAKAVALLQSQGIIVSLFIDPEIRQIEAAAACKSNYIEMHTGKFANTIGADRQAELERLVAGAELAHKLKLNVNAGHGIDYDNIDLLLEKVPFLRELNIGYSIVGRAVMVGMKQAVTEMLHLMRNYHKGPEEV
ncbi:MAG: pyridoxine 5'-phosphate synthase, partial [Victivallaceae bacterium]|nr:pyridoxine 5'-phosphate synthase [Victivallaceae bacterium]